MSSVSSNSFRCREMVPGDRPAVSELARSLTEFFPQDVVSLIDTAIEKNPALVGEMGDRLVGFLVYTIRDSQTAEIVWMGIDTEYHGLGLGSSMLQQLEEMLEERGVRKLVASTLSYTVDYKPFEKVRTFYYHRGFSSIGIQNNYYDDGLDRLLLVKKLY